MEITELKRKLRQLKKFETQIRFKDSQLTQCKQYVWNDYFSTKDEYDDSVKYDMKSLMEMDHEKLKEETIKSKFRELAKKYHPDLGGDSSKFIELVNTYKKLIGDK